MHAHTTQSHTTQSHTSLTRILTRCARSDSLRSFGAKKGNLIILGKDVGDPGALLVVSVVRLADGNGEDGDVADLLAVVVDLADLRAELGVQRVGIREGDVGDDLTIVVHELEVVVVGDGTQGVRLRRHGKVLEHRVVRENLSVLLVGQHTLASHKLLGVTVLSGPGKLHVGDLADVRV